MPDSGIVALAPPLGVLGRLSPLFCSFDTLMLFPHYSGRGTQWHVANGILGVGRWYRWWGGSWALGVADVCGHAGGIG